MRFKQPPGSRVVSTAPFAGVVIEDSSIDRFLRDGGTPEDLFAARTVLLKSSRSTRTAVVRVPSSDSPACSHEEVFMKEYRFKHPLHPLKFFFFEHRAPAVWQMSWLLLDLGINVPHPIGYLIRHVGPYYLRGYFFSRVVVHAHTLGELASDAERLNRRLLSGRIMDCLANDAALMHRNGLAHGDFNWSNILLHESEDRLWLVDFDAARRFRHPSNPVNFARDLARFTLHAGELGVDQCFVDRFLEVYARECNQTREQVDRVLAKAVRRLNRKDRSLGGLFRSG